MSTVADIITLALKDAQIIDETETPSAALMADSLTTLNQMFGMWQASNIYTYATTEATFTATGAASYTIGPTGADITSATPKRINYAFLEQIGVKYPMLEIINNREDFEAISSTTVLALPDAIYYSATHPNGTIYIYPQPSSGTMHLGLDVELPNYALAPDSFSLDILYEMPVRFNLAKILIAMMGTRLTPELDNLAKTSLRQLQRANVVVKELTTTPRTGLINRRADFYSGFVR
jgi:hypothetical protein